MSVLRRTAVDRFLNFLAESDARWIPPMLRLAELVYPEAVRAVEFRRGNITAAARPFRGPERTRMPRKAREMRAVLEHGPWPCPERPESIRSFNGRVLYVVHSAPAFDPSGYTVRSCQVIRALRNEGVHVVAVTRLGYPWDLPGRSSDPIVSSTVFEGIEFLHLHDPQQRISGPESEYVEAYAAELARLAEAHDCSVIHANSNYLNGLAAAAAARRTGCRCVYELRGLWHLTRAAAQTGYSETEHYRYCECMETRAAELADSVVAISGPIRDRLVGHGVAAAKITVIGNHADSDIEPVSRTRQAGNGPLRIGYVGALVAYEGLDVLLAALRELADRDIRVEAVIAGDGPDRHRLERISRELRIDDRVRFLGRVPRAQVAALYAEFDVCVLPRRDLEVTRLVPPLKPLEIMAFGVPLIASDLPAIREAVDSPGQAILVEQGSPTALARSLMLFLDDRAGISQRAAQAVRLVCEQRAWRTGVTGYVSIYSGLTEMQRTTGSPNGSDG